MNQRNSRMVALTVMHPDNRCTITKLHETLDKAGGNKRRITRAENKPLCLRLLHDREHAGQRSWVIPKSILINGVSAALINIDMAIGTDGHCRNLICKRVSNMLPKWL